MAEQFEKARKFIYTHARLLERLLFAVRFQGASPNAVASLIAAYQNPDEGLGHALEPDLRCPESQPLFVEIGLAALRTASLQNSALSLSLCNFLESKSDSSGLVPILLPSALKTPHAPHWQATGKPGLNPTASICGLLHYQNIEHPWLARATQTCCELLVKTPPKEAHTLLCAAILAEHLPDRRSASEIIEMIRVTLPEADFYIPYAPVKNYGLTPLDFAPNPASPLRHLFTDNQINGHLAHLMEMQQADGGWPITWEAPGLAATSEWRGIGTLKALSILVDYGLIEVE